MREPFAFWHQIATSSGLAFALPEEQQIHLTGSDARRFLNGQLTADVRRLQPGEHLRACLLTPKGKIFSEVWCQVQGTSPDEAFILRVPAALGEEVLARLDRYLVADDVSLDLQPAPRLWHCLLPHGLEFKNGPHLKATRRRIPGLDIPEEDWKSFAHDHPNLQTLTPEEAHHFRLASGEPSYPEELAAQPFPAEVGLDQSAVDFHKGCYLGQEVVSRLESVGRVRQQLHRVVSINPDPDLAPKIGQPLFRDSQPVGQLTSWSAVEALPKIGLAMLKVTEVEPGTELHLQSSPSLPSALEALPLWPEFPHGQS
jgi:folate-binding protein YgfZ